MKDFHFGLAFTNYYYFFHIAIESLTVEFNVFISGYGFWIKMLSYSFITSFILEKEKRIIIYRSISRY